MTTTPHNPDLNVRAAMPGDVLFYIQPHGERAICRVRVLRTGARMVNVVRIYEDGTEEIGLRREWRGRRLDQDGEGRTPCAYAPLGGELFWRAGDALRWHAASAEEEAAVLLERAATKQWEAAQLRMRANVLEGLTTEEAL